MPQKKSPKAKKAISPKNRELVLLDTGPVVGLFNSRDDWHEKCKLFFGQVNYYDFLLTHAVVCEVVFHIQQAKHAGSASAAVDNFLRMIEQGDLKLHKDNSEYISRIRALRQKYSDKKVDIADLSLILAAEDCQISKIVTIDQKDFRFLTFARDNKVRSQVHFEIILPQLE